MAVCNVMSRVCVIYVWCVMLIKNNYFSPCQQDAVPAASAAVAGFWQGLQTAVTAVTAMMELAKWACTYVP